MKKTNYVGNLKNLSTTNYTRLMAAVNHTHTHTPNLLFLFFLRLHYVIDVNNVCMWFNLSVNERFKCVTLFFECKQHEFMVPITAGAVCSLGIAPCKQNSQHSYTHTLQINVALAATCWHKLIAEKKKSRLWYVVHVYGNGFFFCSALPKLM